MKSKKLIATVIAIGALSLAICGCSDGWQKDETATVFPVSAHSDTGEVTMGDVMPFYDNGVMNIYHLKNSTGSLSTYYHPIARLTTSDFVHYTDEGVILDYVEEFNSPDAALGTGSFIKDSSGTYHCFYTGHNGEKDTGLKYVEVIRHATSTDQKTWTKIEEFNLYGYSNDFRDPYVYYDEYDEQYYMLVTTNQYGKGVIKRYSSTTLNADDEEWIDRGVFFENDSGSYNMECPNYIEYNGYYYLAYSEQGENRVTHYRYRTERNGAWKRFERDSIDASGFYAGQLEKAGNKIYAFAWCAKLTGGSVGDFDWGGNLVTHEIRQMSNGELCAVPVENVQNAVNHPVKYTFSDGSEANGFTFDGGKFSARSVSALSKGVVRICFNVAMDDFGGDFGLTFGLKDALDNRLGAAVIAFDPVNSSLTCYNDVSNILRYGSALAKVGFAYSTGKSYKVEALIDGEIVTVYLDGSVALTARIPDMDGNNFSFYSNGVSVKFTEINYYE